MTQFTGQLWVPPLVVAVQQLLRWRTIYGGRCRVSLSRRLSPSNIPIGCVLAPRFLHPLRGEKPGPVHSSFRGRDRRLTDGDNYFNATRSTKSGCGWLSQRASQRQGGSGASGPIAACCLASRSRTPITRPPSRLTWPYPREHRATRLVLRPNYKRASCELLSRYFARHGCR
jgi:hypothetical protein